MPHLSLSLMTAVLLAYLCGSLSSAILICRWMKLPDPRSQGSNNPGATNVLRIGGKKAAILTLLGDALKGFLPVILAKLYGFSSTELALIACAAFLGHLYPVFFRFQGGKGVATAFGSLSGLAWPIGPILLACWLTVAFIFRYSSLAALVTALFSPICVGYFVNLDAACIAAFMSALLIYRHKSNIKKLWAGEEAKIGKK
ncbi:MAG: glycerol-3-phosphate 1-O-acyltransferase PlsY [Gammaproteobacteria bacterium]|nr:glycerol-3-phosphate 1-O-acyltransferase PlsY [Gammaproteobacteria bacterium]